MALHAYGGRYDIEVTSATVIDIPTVGSGTRVWSYGDPDGEPLLLVHGFRGDHHGLEPLAQALVDRHPHVHALVPDLPGFGDTDPLPGRTHNLDTYGDWLVQLWEATTQGRGAILGHSFGSLVVGAAHARGLRADHTVLVNPIAAPALEGPQAVWTQLAIAYYRVADALPERAARALLGQPGIVRVMSEVMAKTRDPELRRWIHAQHRAYFSTFSDARTLLEAFRASVSHTVMEFAETFDSPTLLIAGDRDDITPLTAQLELEQRIPQAQLRVIPGTGHLVHYEAVNDAAGWIGDFLGESR